MSPAAGRSALVIGAGVAGLAAASSLADLGYEVRLVERGDALRTEGAGITLWPNATRALREVGLASVCEACGHAIVDGATLKPSGETIARAPLARIAARFGPLLSMHRAELLEALQDACPVPVEFGMAARCEQGTLRLAEELPAPDLTIGADGIGSVAREAIVPGVRPRSAGYGAWRGVAATGPMTPTRVTETLGRGLRFGLVPLSGDRTYWFAVVADGGADADLETVFARWHEPIPAVLAATAPQDRSYLELRDLPSLPRRRTDRAVLIGDAAHAMTPNLGQGAAQALLDVARLKLELARRPHPAALAAYEGARKRRAERIVRRSRIVGRVAQASHPLAVRVRDRAARMVPEALLAHQMSAVLR